MGSWPGPGVEELGIGAKLGNCLAAEAGLLVKGWWGRGLCSDSEGALLSSPL